MHKMEEEHNCEEDALKHPRSYENQVALRCFVEESDIASTALYLASPRLAGRVTGQVISVDGGISV